MCPKHFLKPYKISPLYFMGSETCHGWGFDYDCHRAIFFLDPSGVKAWADRRIIVFGSRQYMPSMVFGSRSWQYTHKVGPRLKAYC